MCGICGKLYYDAGRPVEAQQLQSMMDIMFHRGPDGEGKYVSGPVGIGHRRLAIIDLNRGAQPMCNEDSTIWLVFNGEIYNFAELRQELVAKGHKFTSNSDTEAIIHAYEEYGVECLKRLEGMFALALWDERTKTLFLARDRVGIKPLYFHQNAAFFSFASEIKSLLCDPAVEREIDPKAIDRFLSYIYLPGSATLLKGVQKLEPGHYIVVRNGRVDVRQYWDLSFGPTRSISFEDASGELLDLLSRTVRRYMISDVPVGFLLSGGLDSTALLACAVTETDKRISTFTIGFEGEGFADERPYARMAAERFGTDHYETTISAEQFSEFLPKYVWHMEEPICEPPAVALYYVSQLAASKVKVVLSGEGGDEAFGGYQNYRNLLLLEKAKRLAGPMRPALGSLVRTLARIPSFHRAQKYAPLITASFPDYYYSRVSSPFSYFNRNKAELYTADFRRTLHLNGAASPNRGLLNRVQNEHPLHQMLYLDTKTWLPDDLLVKADKMTMANSLELRVPLLDHHILEFAASLPAKYKVQGFTTKRILKHACRRRIPEQIIDRKKTGFPVPYERWLRNELRDYTRDVLLDASIVKSGYFDRGSVQRLLHDYETGAPLAKEVFCLLTLELWCQNFVNSNSCQPSLSGV